MSRGFWLSFLATFSMQKIANSSLSLSKLVCVVSIMHNPPFICGELALHRRAAPAQHCTAPALHHRCTSAAHEHHFLVARCSLCIVYLKTCCSFAQKTPARDTSRKKFGKVLAKQIPLCIIPSYKFFDENTTFRLLCYSESGMVKADRASANRYHL